MSGFFGDLPNGGRGAGYDTPEVDNEGVVVPDIISTLPLDKVAKLSPTSSLTVYLVCSRINSAASDSIGGVAASLSTCRP
eukprot:COSAG03_NODE_14581_length_459_cov_0.652778_1_plen_79_part_01